MRLRLIFITSTTVMTLLMAQLHAQLYNQNWLFGHPPAIPEDHFGGAWIKFDKNPPQVIYFEIPIFFDACAMISDQEGNLIAYTNGCSIVGADHTLLPNGEEINGGVVHDGWCDYGYPIGQGALFVPVSTGSDSIFRLIHLWRDDNIDVAELRYTEIVNDEARDSVYVGLKDIVVDSLYLTKDLTAVRHANGRDWWIVQALSESNQFNKYISDPMAIKKVDSQLVGTAWTHRDWSGQATFSPDGTKFVRVNPFNGLYIYDFDRCTGLLSEPEIIEFNNDTIVSCGAAFSPNNRFLYVSATLWVYQYDMWAQDIAASRVTVAEYDGFQAPFSTTFFQQMLAPNGKIYITAPNGVYYLHVIHEPNNKGLDCNLEQHGVKLTARHPFYAPNFPHYRLGPLQDSPCDTLGIVSTHDLQEPGFSFTLYPNPASTEIYLSLDIPSTSTDDLVCTVLSMDGRTHLRIALDASTERIDVRELPPGVYVACVSNRGGVVGQQRGINILALVLMSSMASVSQVNTSCIDLDEWNLPGGETLCEEIDDFSISPEFVGGISTTYWSQEGYGFALVNKDVIITGTLILDEPAGFYNCRIKMGRNAKIIILDTKFLFSWNSKWFTCVDMWEGIEVNEGGSFRSSFSEYEDAKYLITAESGAILSLVNNTFNRNHIVLRNSNASSDYEGIIFNAFHSNTFTCTSQLNDDELSEITFAGVYLDHAIASIGNLHAQNNFSYLMNGIIAYNSSVNLLNLHFDFMLGDGPSVSSGGFGVYGEGGDIQIRAVYQNDNWVGRTTFENCQLYAVLTDGSSLHIEAATFDGEMWGGVFVGNNQAGQSVIIEDCYFELNEPECSHAIAIERGVGAGEEAHYIIQHDTIVVGEIPVFAGIFVIEDFPAIDKMIIDSNYIVTSETSSGKMIWVISETQDKFKITENDITCDSDEFEAFRYGIVALFTTGIGHEVNYNEIVGIGQHEPFQCAIHLEDAQNISLCDNTVDLSRRGIHLVGANAPLRMRNTNIQEHERGLLINHSPRFEGINGTQLRHGNMWSTTSSDYSAFAAECVADPLKNLFIVDDDALDLLPENISPEEGWFIHSPGSTNYCIEAPLDPIISSFDSAVIQYLFVDTLNTNASIWYAKKNVMLKLMRFDSLLSKWNAAEQFYESGIDSTYGKHASAEFEYFDAMLFNTSLQQELDSLQNLLNDALLQLALVDSSGSRDIDSLNLDSIILNNAIGWLDSLQFISDSLQVVRNSIKDTQDVALGAVLTSASNLPDVRHFEANNKNLLQIRVRMALSDTMSVSDFNTLESMAEQSIDTSGRSVIWARYLVHPCAEEYDYVYEGTEEEENEAISGTREDDKSKYAMSIFGNPSTGQTIVHWSDEVTGKLTILTLDGKVLEELDVANARSIKIDLRNAPSGTLVFAFMEQRNGIVHTKRVIVHH